MSRDKMADLILGMIPVFHRKIAKRFKSKDFKPGEFMLLKGLMFEDGLPMHTYGERFSFSKPNLTKLVNELEEKGWVRKEKSLKDKRVVHLYISELGKKQLESHYKFIKQNVMDSTDMLTDEEVETVIENFESIYQIFTKLEDNQDDFM